jgi:hypothetical protein
MTDDLIFEELPPGRYNGTVEKVRYSFNAATHVVITYKVAWFGIGHAGLPRMGDRLQAVNFARVQPTSNLLETANGRLIEAIGAP